MRLALLRERLEPGERIARGDVERSKRQALAQRATNVRSRNRIIFPSPHRHVRPRLHFLLSQKFLAYPSKLRVRLQGALNSVQHPADAEEFGRAGRVVNSCLTVLGHANGPFSKIPRIDELDGIVWLSRRQHLSGTIDAHRPIRKAVALVARADDKSWANDQSFSGKPFLGFAFRERL